MQLQQLFDKYFLFGLRILGFPCNQFGNQEPKNNKEIEIFARQFGVTFDLYSKINVNGVGASPLYKYLKSHRNTPGLLTNDIKWNFTKFLVDKTGQPIKRFSPNITPLDFEKELKTLF